MSILIFVLVLAVLIFVHELGHFLAAKFFHVRVDTFAIGFQPTLWKTKRGETTYKLNLIPFGGYVKIFGEDYEEAANEPRSFIKKPWWQQVIILLAGILFNLILAWILLSATFAIGVLQPSDNLPENAYIEDQEVVVINTLPDSSAELILKPGDFLKEINGHMVTDGAMFRETVSSMSESVVVTYERNGEIFTHTIQPVFNENLGRNIIGIGIEDLSFARLPIHTALWSGLTTTGVMTARVGEAFAQLIRDAFIGEAKLNTLTGPVGLVTVVGDATRIGISSLLTLVALISVNLAVLNVIPFPALDGGRVLFVLIEKIIRRPINRKVAEWINGIGFLLLILLLIVVTVSDVVKLF